MDCLNRMVREKKELEQTKTNLKIRILRDKKPKGLQVVKEADPKDKDVKVANKKHHAMKEISLSKGGELTQSLSLKLKKIA
jgi:hypothetical protein